MGTFKIGLYKNKNLHIGIAETVHSVILYKLFAFQPIILEKKEREVLELLRSNKEIMLQKGNGSNNKRRSSRVKTVETSLRRRPSKFTFGTLQFLNTEIRELIKSPVFELWRVFIPRKEKTEIRYFLVLHKRYVTPVEVAISSFQEQYEQEWKPMLKEKKIKWVIKDDVLLRGVSLHNGKLVPVIDVLGKKGIPVGEVVPLVDAKSVLVHVQDQKRPSDLPFPRFTPYELSEKGLQLAFPVFIAGRNTETRKIIRSLVQHKQIIFTTSPEEFQGTLVYPGRHIMFDPFRELRPQDVLMLLNLSVTNMNVKSDVFLMAWDKIKEKLEEEGKTLTFQAFMKELQDMEGLAILSSVQYQVLAALLAIYEGGASLFKQTTLTALIDKGNIIIDVSGVPLETQVFFVLGLSLYLAKRARHELIPVLTYDQISIKLVDRFDASTLQAFYHSLLDQVPVIMNTEGYSSSTNIFWEQAKTEIITQTADSRIRDTFEKRHALESNTSEIIRNLEKNEFLLVSPQTDYAVKRIVFTPKQPSLFLSQTGQRDKQEEQKKNELTWSIHEWGLLLLDSIITEISSDDSLDETLILTALQNYTSNPLQIIESLKKKKFLVQDTDNQLHLTAIAEETRITLRIQLLAWIEKHLQEVTDDTRKQALMEKDPDNMSKEELWETSIYLAETLMNMNRFSDMIHVIWELMKIKQGKTRIEYFRQVLNKYMFETQAYHTDDAFPPEWEEPIHTRNEEQQQEKETPRIEETSIRDEFTAFSFEDTTNTIESSNTKKHDDELRDYNTGNGRHPFSSFDTKDPRDKKSLHQEVQETKQSQTVMLETTKPNTKQVQATKKKLEDDTGIYNIPLPGQEQANISSLRLIEFTERTLNLMDSYTMIEAINVSFRVLCADTFGFYPQQLDAQEILEALQLPYQQRNATFPLPIPLGIQELQQQTQKLLSYAMKKETITRFLESIEKKLGQLKYNLREQDLIKKELVKRNNSKET